MAGPVPWQVLTVLAPLLPLGKDAATRNSHWARQSCTVPAAAVLDPASQPGPARLRLDAPTHQRQLMASMLFSSAYVDTAMFFTTPVPADGDAWNQLEVTFQEPMETQRQWSDRAIARTTPALLGLFSWTTLAAHALQKRPLLAAVSLISPGSAILGCQLEPHLGHCIPSR